MKPQHSDYQKLLRQKAEQIETSLRKRGGIAIEYCAEETEQITLKDERDMAVLALDRETLLLREVRAAQSKLAKGTFGVCEECEKEIPARRLAVLPWARRCVACQEKEDLAHRARSFRDFRLAA